MRRPQKSCPFCEGRVRWIDYKDDRTLGRFITDQGKILPSRLSGTCARHQRQLSTAIKRARFLALIPYIRGHRVDVRRRHERHEASVVAAAAVGAGCFFCCPVVPAGGCDLPHSADTPAVRSCARRLLDHRVEVGKPRRSRDHLAWARGVDAAAAARRRTRHAPTATDGARLGDPARCEFRPGQPSELGDAILRPGPRLRWNCSGRRATIALSSPVGSPGSSTRWGRIHAARDGQSQSVSAEVGRPAVEGSDGEGAVAADRADDWAAEIERDLPRRTTPLIPALLALESLAALGLAWAVYHRLSTRENRTGARAADRISLQRPADLGAGRWADPQSPPGVSPKDATPGFNLLLFFGALYVVRGLGILAWISKGRYLFIILLSLIPAGCRACWG